MRVINKKNQGITLIALVITIIVLLILAGVAISMLSGENGILSRASEAKEKTEEAQKEEGGALLSYELVLNNSKYKYQYGYLTGFEYDKNERHTAETVEDLEKELQKLSSGYKVSSKYNYRENKDETIEEEEKESLSIATGMTITKDGQEVARTVLFGDVNCDGEINTSDATNLDYYIGFWRKTWVIDNFKYFQRFAGNVRNDEELNTEDSTKLDKYVAGTMDAEDINQQEIIVTSPQNIRRNYTTLQEYIKSLDESTGYTFEYDEDEDTYILKGVAENTTAENLINLLPQKDKIKIYEINGARDKTEINGESIVKDGYYLYLEENGYFAYIEVE